MNRIQTIFILAVAALLIADPLAHLSVETVVSRPRASKTVCVQVVSCGMKNGKAKEYPDPCAAQRDGATDIHPMSGQSCGSPRIINPSHSR